MSPWGRCMSWSCRIPPCAGLTTFGGGSGSEAAGPGGGGAGRTRQPAPSNAVRRRWKFGLSLSSEKSLPDGTALPLFPFHVCVCACVCAPRLLIPRSRFAVWVGAEIPTRDNPRREGANPRGKPGRRQGPVPGLYGEWSGWEWGSEGPSGFLSNGCVPKKGQSPPPYHSPPLAQGGGLGWGIFQNRSCNL